MRLYNIYYICKQSYDGIKNFEYQDSKDTKIKIISGWKNTKQGYELLRQIKFMKNDIDSAFETIPVYLQEYDKPAISLDSAVKLKQIHEKIKYKVIAIIDLYESLDAGEAKEGIDIKVPKCHDFKEYLQYLKDLDFIFNQCPFIINDTEKLQFNTVDVGSMWLSFIVIGSTTSHIILNVLAKLSEMAIKYKSNFTLIRQQDEQLRAMQLKNEISEEVFSIFKKMKESTLNNITSEFEKECGQKIEDPEKRHKAALSIKKMSDLIDKGLEIYATIETPSEIKVQFPFTENAPLLPDGLQKLIEEKNKESNKQ